MISGAFTRSRTVLARYDVSPHMVKWWKGFKPDDGQVRELCRFGSFSLRENIRRVTFSLLLDVALVVG
jgi:hypothetical protein